MAQVDTTPKQTVREMTEFRWNALYVIAAAEPVKGTKICEELEDYYGSEVNHGRLYPNLDTLVDMGLVTKRERDRRTNEYRVTERAEAAMAHQQQWERDKFDAEVEA